MNLQVTAPGKLILLGEYAVLEGAPGIVSAVDRFAAVTLRSKSEPPHTLSAPKLNIRKLAFSLARKGIRFGDPLSREVREQLRFVRAVFDYAVREFGLAEGKIPAFHFTLESSQFYRENSSEKLGLGSSAALTVALLGTLFFLSYGKEPTSEDKTQLFKACLNAHRAGQGNQGSGIDIAASMFGGTLCYQADAFAEGIPVETAFINLPENLTVLPVWTGKPASTEKLVDKVMRFKKEQPTQYGPILENLAYLSREGCRALKQADVAAFLRLVEDYYVGLEELSRRSSAPIISPVHQLLHNLVSRKEAVYKPSGAGEGDFGLIFTGNPAVVPELKQAVEEHNFPILNLQNVTEGLKFSIL